MTVIFWDFDGTLVHSKHLWSGSMYKALKAVDPDTSMTFEQIRICNRSGFPWHTPENDQQHLVGDAWWDYMYKHFIKSYTRFGVSQDIAERASLLVHSIIKDYTNYTLYPDALSTLTACRHRGCQNVLLSNNYPDLQDVLDYLGLSPLLDGVILSGLEGYDKPRAELFDIAKIRFPASRYIMVGDNAYADITGGNRASMYTVYVHNGSCADADRSVNSLSEILSIL